MAIDAKAELSGTGRIHPALTPQKPTRDPVLVFAKELKQGDGRFDFAQQAGLVQSKCNTGLTSSPKRVCSKVRVSKGARDGQRPCFAVKLVKTGRQAAETARTSMGQADALPVIFAFCTKRSLKFIDQSNT